MQPGREVAGLFFADDWMKIGVSTGPDFDHTTSVISFGGFLGMGGGYHALPWNTLTYNEKQGGYVVPADKERLRDAPSYQAGEDPFSNPAYSRQVSDYWLVLH